MSRVEWDRPVLLLARVICWQIVNYSVVNSADLSILESMWSMIPNP